MKVPEKDKIVAIKKEVARLCKEATPFVVIPLAASFANWGTSIDKPKSEDDFVDGMVVGTPTFIEAHTEARMSKSEVRRLKAQGVMPKFSDRELATVLAALRYWQREGLMSDGREQDIAGDDGKFDPLTVIEINELCERLNIE